jgi:hypothetical protein
MLRNHGGIAVQGEMTRQQRTQVRALAGLVTALTLLGGAQTCGASTKFNRDVIALYDSIFEAQPDLTSVHRFVEMPLNYLGLRVTYVDVRKPLPDAMTARARAIVLWLRSGAKPPLHALEWVANAADAGAKIVLMGEIAEVSNEGAPIINRLLSRLGLHYEGYEIDATYRARVSRIDKIVTTAERRLNPPLPPFSVVSLESDRSIPHLTILYPRGTGFAESVLVATGPAGGFVANNYAVSHDTRADRHQWMIEPFGFFRRALLDDEKFPVPDVTTISGRRLYFSHIDGDGWSNISTADWYREVHMLSAEVVLRELIEPYPSLPVTVGFVAADGDPDYGAHPRARQIAREIFALPQVQVGSHTYTHPYEWAFYERYDRALERQRLQQAAARKAEPRGALGAQVFSKPDAVDTRLRAYAQRPFDLHVEVEGSLRAAESLAPPGKQATLYQWSGDARPFEAAVRMTRQLGVRNINGGDARLDTVYPSLTYLPPISRAVGDERQIYAVNSNDYTYFEQFPRGQAFLLLEETLRNTESPARLRGFNLNYHMYVGERSASLNAVRHFLALADRGAYVPIEAWRYAAIADSFFSTELWLEGPDRWSIHDRRDIETVRFDQPGDKVIDFSASSGILGMRRHGDALYVSLDPAVDRPVVALRSIEDEPTGSVRRPYLSESRWRLMGLQLAPCRVSFTATGYGPGQMSWHSLSPGRYQVEARQGVEAVWTSEAEVDATGVLNFTIEAAALTPLVVTIRCEGSGR